MSICSRDTQRFVEACSNGCEPGQLRELFRLVPRSEYRRIAQRTPAWYELRRHVPITGSRLWGLLAGDLTPNRPTRGLRFDFYLPHYRKGVTPKACPEMDLIGCIVCTFSSMTWASERACTQLIAVQGKQHRAYMNFAVPSCSGCLQSTRTFGRRS
jgi:hypothetical protein